MPWQTGTSGIVGWRLPVLRRRTAFAAWSFFSPRNAPLSWVGSLRSGNRRFEDFWLDRRRSCSGHLFPLRFVLRSRFSHTCTSHRSRVPCRSHGRGSRVIGVLDSFRPESVGIACHFPTGGSSIPALSYGRGFRMVARLLRREARSFFANGSGCGVGCGPPDSLVERLRDPLTVRAPRSVLRVSWMGSWHSSAAIGCAGCNCGGSNRLHLCRERRP